MTHILFNYFFYFQGGLNSELTITAYVTVALLEAGFDNKVKLYTGNFINCFRLHTITVNLTYSKVIYKLLLESL